MVTTVDNGTLPSKALQDLGIGVLDNGYLNTAVCKSAISFIDGQKGLLRYNT